MRRIKLTLSYDGTDYHGFQRQGRGLICIQDALFAAITAVAGEPPQGFAAAGRTDAGVHAMGQVVAFDTSGSVPTERIAQALNSHLPPDVSVLQAVQVDPSFHPRFDAVAKEYVYTIHGFNGGNRHAMAGRWSLHLAGRLDLEAMDVAARSLIGTYDCSAFQDVGRPVRDATRTIMACRVDSIQYHEAPWTGIPVAQVFVRADGFLLHMVRVIAGTLVAVGRGRFASDSLAAIVGAKDRRRAGPTLPPQGLCLMRVLYPDHQAEVDSAYEGRAPTLVDTPGTVS